jgi:diguanylate cyclase (GGDEF)-like protein
MSSASSRSLTQLYRTMGRNELQHTLDATWARGENYGTPFGLILFSIDRFKLVNGRFGHHLADAVLKQVVRVARATLRNRGSIGRWGGDEFLCILPDTQAAEVVGVAEKLRAAIAGTAFPVSANLVNVTASFGTAAYPDDGSEVRTLLMTADEALHHAKQTGRNRVVTADSLMYHSLRMGDVLDTALREERVMPAYQPIVDLASGNIVAEEALARIVTTDGLTIAAEEFMHVASQFQLTHKIDCTVVLSALDRYLSQPAMDNPILHFVNISGDLLRHPDLFKELLDSVKWLRGGQDAAAAREFPLVIEITERELLGNPDITRQMLAPFIELGARLALDDFGSGYSSFHYLADLPISFLKLDGRFSQRIAEPKVRAIVRGIQNTADELGLTTLAEHVESEREADMMREIGIHWAQGHLYGQARLNEKEADVRRQMSLNWTHGYYYQKT